MDVRALFHFIADNFNLVAGTTLALFFLTSMILLIRSIREGQQESSGGGVSADVGAIESALKRVLSTQPVSVAARSSESRSRALLEDSDQGLENPEVESRLRSELSERDERIDALNHEIERLRLEISSASATSEKFNGEVNPGEIENLKAKMGELQARLSEYEIIEDDIADLSRFKDENSKLKAELEELKTKLGSGEAIVATPETTSVSEPPVNETGKNDQFEIDAEDDVMQEFASAVSLEKAPAASEMSSVSSEVEVDVEAEVAKQESSVTVESPDPVSAPEEISLKEPSLEAKSSADALSEPEALQGDPDTEKLLSEVESLSVDNQEAGDVLEESLNTDKLIAEVGSLGPESQSVSVSESEPVSVSQSESQSEKPKSPREDVSLEDDLLAEFKDASGGDSNQ